MFCPQAYRVLALVIETVRPRFEGRDTGEGNGLRDTETADNGSLDSVEPHRGVLVLIEWQG